MDPITVYVGDFALGPLAAAADGDMWTVATDANGNSLGLLEITRAGNQTFFPDSGAEQSMWVTGNGAGNAVDVASCGPGGVTDSCYMKVAANGTKTQLAMIPTPAGGTYYPSMDQHGNVWQWFSPSMRPGSTSMVPTVQFYCEITPAGTMAIYPFKSDMRDPSGAPAVAANGAAWVEEGEPNIGDFLRVAPR